MIGRFQTALVTGASSGIGRAAALRLRKAGMRVLAVGRDLGALKALETECGAEPIAADVRDLGQMARLFADLAIASRPGFTATRSARKR